MGVKEKKPGPGRRENPAPYLYEEFSFKQISGKGKCFCGYL